MVRSDVWLLSIVAIIIFTMGFFTHKALQDAHKIGQDNNQVYYQVSLDTMDIYLIFKDTLYASYTLSWENESQQEGGEIPVLPGDTYILRNNDQIVLSNNLDSTLTFLHIRDNRLIVDLTYALRIKEGTIYETQHYWVYCESVYLDE